MVVSMLRSVTVMGLFIKCKIFHLLTTFHNDKAEMKCLKMSNGLKNPTAFKLGSLCIGSSS